MMYDVDYKNNNIKLSHRYTNFLIYYDSDVSKI